MATTTETIDPLKDLTSDEWDQADAWIDGLGLVTTEIRRSVEIVHGDEGHTLVVRRYLVDGEGKPKRGEDGYLVDVVHVDLGPEMPVLPWLDALRERRALAAANPSLGQPVGMIAQMDNG